MRSTWPNQFNLCFLINQLESTNPIFLQGKHDFKTKLHTYRNSTVYILAYKRRIPAAYLLRQQDKSSSSHT
jgi:hypothetical protein